MKVLLKVLSTGRFPLSLRKSQFEFPTLRAHLQSFDADFPVWMHIVC